MTNYCFDYKDLHDKMFFNRITALTQNFTSFYIWFSTECHKIFFTFSAVDCHYADIGENFHLLPMTKRMFFNELTIYFLNQVIYNNFRMKKKKLLVNTRIKLQRNKKYFLIILRTIVCLMIKNMSIWLVLYP